MSVLDHGCGVMFAVASYSNCQNSPIMADTCLYTTESVKQLQFVEANLLAKGRGNLTVKDSGAESFCAKTVVALSLFLGLSLIHI